jgi:NADH-quinone oxidoreductase subunit M
MSLLPWTIYLSLAGALLALAAGRRSPARPGGSRSPPPPPVGPALLAAARFVPGRGLQTLVDVPWIPRWACATTSRPTASA